MKAVNSEKRKRVEEVMDLGQGDYQLPGTDKMLTDIAMVPPILMAGIKSTGYKSKRSDLRNGNTQPMWGEHNERL